MKWVDAQTDVTLMERHDYTWIEVSLVPAAQFWASPHAAFTQLAQFSRLVLEHLKSDRSNRELLISIPTVREDGFDIDMHVDRHRVRTSFGGLDEDFFNIEEAFEWVRRAVSGEYELEIWAIGQLPVRWSLKPILPLEGAPTLSTGASPWFLSFRRTAIKYRRNGFDPRRGMKVGLRLVPGT